MLQTDKLTAAAPQRIITAQSISSQEELLERALRPKTLADYIGQAKAKEQLAIFIEAAKKRGEALDHVLQGGQAILEQGGSALDAVTEAVLRLEECPLFNAGKGAVFTHAGTHELDASIMDGRTLAAGAVACVKSLRNPILAARHVMEDGRHVLLVGEGAEAFARSAGLEIVSPEYYFTEARYDQWQRALIEGKPGLLDHDAQSLAAEPIDVGTKMGTVGDFALDAGAAGGHAPGPGSWRLALPGAADPHRHARPVGAAAEGCGSAALRLRRHRPPGRGGLGHPG